VGAVSGALAIGMLGPRHPPLAVLFVSATVACTGLLGMSTVRHVWTAIPILAITGFSGIVLVASCNTALQLSAPDALRGRVMSLYTFVYGGVFPIGSFLVGAISERWGVSMAFLLSGSFGLVTLTLIGAWWMLRRDEGADAVESGGHG
jgi:predicted MFS family arabinose efflux permease